MDPTAKKIGHLGLAIYLILAIFVSWIPSFTQVVYAEASEKQTLFKNEFVEVAYQSELDQTGQQIRWGIFIKKQQQASATQLGLDFDTQALGGFQEISIPEGCQYDAKTLTFVERGTSNAAQDYQITFTTPIKEEKSAYELGLEVYGNVQTENGIETIDFGAEAKKLILVTSGSGEAPKSEQTQPSPITDGELKFDLTGKTTNLPLTTTKFMIMLPGTSDFVEYDATNPDHVLVEQSQVQLKYEFDIETFLVDPKTSQDFYDLVMSGRESYEKDPTTEIEYEFSFAVDGRIQLGNSGKAGPYKITQGEKEYGYFEIVATDDPVFHQINVVLTTETFVQSNVQGEFHFNCELELDGKGKPIVVFKDEDQVVEVPIRETEIGFTLEKTAGDILPYDKELAASPVQWQVTVTPDEGQTLKDLVLKDKDYTVVTSWSAGGGFQFPTTKERETLKGNAETDPNFYVKVGGVLLKEGTDYKFNLQSYRKSDLTITFIGDYKAGIDQPVEIGLTTLPLKNHPSLLTNKVVAETSNAGQLETEASLTVNENALYKNGTNLGNGQIEWVVDYQRGTHTTDITFEDTITGAKIDSTTVKVYYFNQEAGTNQNKYLEVDQQFWEVTPKSDQSGFSLTFTKDLPAGCYQIKYVSQSSEQETATKVVNEIKSDSQADLSGTGTVPLTGIVVKKSTSGAGASAYSKYVQWKFTINSKPQADGYLTIRDANKNDGLHYYYDPDFTFEQAKAEWADKTKRAAIKEEYGKNSYGSYLASDNDPNSAERYYRLKKGIVGYCKEPGSETYEMIPPEDLEDLVIRNNTNDTTDAGLESQTGSWTGKRAGFEVKLDARKYAGKELRFEVATKFGNAEDLKPQDSDAKPDKYMNAVEVLLGNDKATSETSAWFSTSNIGKRILKKGELTNDNKVRWWILSNFLMHPLKKGDTIIDKLNCSKDGSFDGKNDLLTLSAADLNKLKVYTIDTTKQADPTAKETEAAFLNRKIVKTLVKDQDYRITPTADGKQFMIEFLEDQGLYGIGVEFETDYDLSKASQIAEDESSQLLLKNYAEENLSGYQNKATAEIAITHKNGIATKSADNFNESEASNGQSATLDWKLVLNTAAKEMQQVVISDSPDSNQIIDLSSVKVYKAKLDSTGEYVADKTQQLSEAITGKAGRNGENDLRGFKLTFAQDFRLNFPIVVEYTAEITSISSTHVKNQAKITWGETGEGTVDEIIKIRDGGGEAQGTEYTLALKKHDQNGNELKGIAFELEYSAKTENPTWRPVATKETNDHGELNFTGLYTGIYRLKEKIPVGYQGYNGWVTFTIKAGQPVTLQPDLNNLEQDLTKFYQLGNSGTEKNLILLQAINQHQPGVLPSTGGAGNLKLVPLALLFVSCSVGIALYLQRREGGKSE